MLTITQRELLHFRQVAGKTFSTNRLRKKGTRITFVGNDEGTTITLQLDDIRLTYQNREPQAAETTFSVDAGDLRAFMKAGDEAVLIRLSDDSGTCSLAAGTTLVSGITCQTEQVAEARPPVASAIADTALSAHLADCCRMTDNSSTRFALQCLQLDGDARTIAGTDGRKALRIGDCDWPWDDARLVPSTGWFAASAVRKSTRGLTIDNFGDSVRFTNGLWSVELPFRAGRFPEVARVFPARCQADTIVRFGDGDHQTIADAVRFLPKAKGAGENAITLELGDPCVLRVTGGPAGAVSEVALAGTRYSGLPFRAALPRHALADFARLGFSELLATEGAKTFWCREGKRQFAFMPLHPDFAVSAASGSLDKAAA